MKRISILNGVFCLPKFSMMLLAAWIIMLPPVAATAQDLQASNQDADIESAFDRIIIKVARNHDMDPALIKAIIKVESRYDHKAVSPRGARGLMQLMPNTAKAMGIRDLFDPEKNIQAGTKYIKHLLAKFDGEVKLALAAYNAGSTKVRKYNGVPPFKTTRRYIKKVMKYYHQYRTEMTAIAQVMLPS